MAVLWFTRSRQKLTPPYPQNRLVFDILPNFEVMEDDRRDYQVLPDLSNLKLSDLLTEAIYFFNFQNTIVRKYNWIPINKQYYSGVLEDMRWYFHNNTANLLHSFYSLSPQYKADTYLGKYYNTDTYPYETLNKNFRANPTFWDPANRARFAVRMSISPMFRTSKFDEQHHGQNKKKGHLYGLKLEQIETKLRYGREKIKQLLQNLPDRPYYSVGIYWIYEINRRQNIFNGYLGKVFVPILETFKSSNPHKETDTSSLQYLSEYLYIAIQHRDLGDNHLKLTNTKRSKSSPALKGTFYTLFYEDLKEIDANISIIFRPGYSYLVKYFSAWENQLDELYCTFSLQNEQDEQLRAYLGIDWAMVLILTLKWYLTDLKLRILMTSLPAWYFYETRGRNSYIGIGLWEAISGWALKSPFLPNILNVELPVEDSYKVKEEENYVQQDLNLGYINPKPNSMRDLIGDIRIWQDLVKTTAVDAFQGSRAGFVGHAEYVMRSFAERILIKSSSKRKGRPRTFVDSMVMELAADFITPFHPVLQRESGNVSKAAEKLKLGRPDFFQLTNVIRNPVSLLNFGAIFSAQLQYYVATEILAMVGELLGLSTFYETQFATHEKSPEKRQLLKDLNALPWSRSNLQQKEYVKKRLEYQRLDEKFQLAMNSGNYLCGGSFPPHKTHRDGRHYDTNMGPDTIPWRSTNLHKILKSAYSYIKQYGSAEEQKLVDKYNTNYPIHRAEQVPGDIIKKNMMLLHYADLRDHADGELRKIYGASEDNIKDLEKAEAQLYGTPHFQEKDDVELSQIGTTAILISGPERIVYSSPLVMGRAIWQLKKEFKQVQKQINEEIGMPEFQEIILPDIMEVIHPTRGCDFAFLPADHHNHWHLYYRKKDPLRWLEKVKVLWMFLGVDLIRFIRYLEQYETFGLLRMESSDKFGTFAPVVQEWKDVLEFCRDYEIEKSILNSYSYWDEGQALDLLETIFSPMSINGGSGELLEPFAIKPASSDLRRMSQTLHEHLFKVKASISRIAGTVEDAEEKEKITKVLYDFQEEFGLNPKRMTFEEFYENFGELDGDIEEDTAFIDVAIPDQTMASGDDVRNTYTPQL